MKTENNKINNTKRVSTGLSFIIFPLIFTFAFATHPNLLNSRFLEPAELIQRAHNNSMLHLGHALVTLCTGLLVVVAIHFMNVLKDTRQEWLGFVGGILAILGALILAADKGALCLTMSALDNLSKEQFLNILPGLLAIYGKQGWLILIEGLPLLTVGFVIQAVGLLKSKSLAKWQCRLFLIGVIFIGTPDGVEIINLTAAILLSIAFVPYGLKMIVNR